MSQYFIISKEKLDELQYLRLKQQINDTWDKNLPRPLLLEGDILVTSSGGTLPPYVRRMQDELSRIAVGACITTEHFNRIQRLLQEIEA